MVHLGFHDLPAPLGAEVKSFALEKNYPGLPLQLGFASDLTWIRLLTDWGSLIGGGLAFVAGVIAYLAGRSQATATRRAADAQIAAERRSYDQGVETLHNSIALEFRLVVGRAFGAHISLAKLYAPSSDPITSRMIESSVVIPLPVVYPVIADRIALLKDDAMDVIITYQLIEVAREYASQLVHYRTPDNISKVNVMAVADGFLAACLYAKGVLPKLKTGMPDHDDKDAALIKRIETAATAWSAVKVGWHKNSFS